MVQYSLVTVPHSMNLWMVDMSSAPSMSHISSLRFEEKYRFSYLILPIDVNLARLFVMIAIVLCLSLLVYVDINN